MFHSSVRLETTRPVKHFGDISKEVLDHLVGRVGAEVEVRVEIVAKRPGGSSDHTVRKVTENARTLKFDESAGFSED